MMTDINLNGCENAESDEAEEEVEPKLKYVRMTNDLQDILVNDAASCIAVHPKFICVGSHYGSIHLLDHQGNNIRGKKLQMHTVAVNQISIDSQGEYIASCSDDGRVYIVGLYANENDQSFSTARLVKSVALDPGDSRNGTRIIIGDDKLNLYEKTFTFLSRLKQTVLCESEGNVSNVSWCGQFIAWASSIGIRVYDIQARCSLGLIQWERATDDTPLELYRCNLRWADNRTLLIGWMDVVRVCVIRKRSGNQNDMPEYLVDPISTFHTDFYISGVAPLEQQLVLLGVPKDSLAGKDGMRPQLHVIEYRDNDYTEICTDSLSLRGYQKWKCNDYHLEVLPDENRFFVMAPKDLVVASLYEPDDRIQWLVQHGRYEEALSAVASSLPHPRKHTEASVGAAYLDHLLIQERFQEAARLCLKVFGRDRCLWQEHIYKFARAHQLRAVSAYLPRGQQDDARLDPHIYEMVLYEYLKLEPIGFLSLVREWQQPGLYNTAAVINAVLEHLLVCDGNSDKNTFMEALAVLYSHEGKYDKALSMYLKLQHPGVFQLIQNNNLYGSVRGMIVELMTLDADRAVDLLLQHGPGTARPVPSLEVVARLEGHDNLLYRYLHALHRKDARESAPYHGRMVRLYSIFARDLLLPFLKMSDQYPIQEALDICQRQKYYPEMVYLLGRIGDTREALELINTELQDIQQALEFCQEHDDPDLWANLIGHALNKPDLITFLLPRIGGHVDPRVLVQSMAKGLRVPGLKQALINMLRQYNLQLSIQEGCQKILVADYFRLHEKLVKAQQRGVLISDELLCGACHRRVISRPAGLVVYNCKHTFHEQCLPLPTCHHCAICHRADL